MSNLRKHLIITNRFSKRATALSNEPYILHTSEGWYPVLFVDSGFLQNGLFNVFSLLIEHNEARLAISSSTKLTGNFL